MKIGFVIPARLKSKRLEKKILLRLGNQSALEWAIDRATLAQSVDEVVVATTPLQTDMPITKICCEKGIRYFQGDPYDVLKRLRDTTEFFDFDYIVNITPDNTLFSMYMIELMVAKIKNNSYGDYFRFHDAMLGTGIYALKKEALQTACDFKDMTDTEIWGPFLHEQYFRVVDLEVPEFLKSDYRLTLDTQADYIMISRIYNELKITTDNIVETESIIQFLNQHPEIANINAQEEQTTVPLKVLEDINNFFKQNEKKLFEIKKKYYK